MKRIFIILLSIFSLTAFAQIDDEKRVQQLFSQIIEGMDVIDTSLPQINILIKKGEKSQAKSIIEKSLKEIEKIEKDRIRLAQTEITDDNIPSLAQIQETKSYLIYKLNQLQYTNLCIYCEAKLFDSKYEIFKNELQGFLAENNCSFVEDVQQADWVITINASAREGNTITTGSFVTYFSYVDLKLSIDNKANGKRIYQNAFSEKGGHTHNYEQAARQAYKDISPKISTIIKEQIQQ